MIVIPLVRYLRSGTLLPALGSEQCFISERGLQELAVVLPSLDIKFFNEIADLRETRILRATLLEEVRLQPYRD